MPTAFLAAACFPVRVVVKVFEVARRERTQPPRGSAPRSPSGGRSAAATVPSSSSSASMALTADGNARTPPLPLPILLLNRSRTEESRWLAALSEPELDLLISLKMLAVKRAETAGRPHLADAFDLRTLRALGVVLLEDFKQRLREETSLDATVLDRLALSRDPVTEVSVGSSSSDSEVFRQRSKDQPNPSGVKKKRKQTHDGRHGEAVQRNKKRRKTSERR